MNFVNNMKRIRQEKKLSLQELADLSGVSKSMLSKIEREEKNPTLQLAAQIAEGLGTTLSVLLAEQQEQSIIITRYNNRVVYCDEISGFERQLLSPSIQVKGIEFIFNIIPIGKESPLFPMHQKGVKEYVVVSQGNLKVMLGNECYELATGDTIYFEADIPHKFFNIGETDCHYYLVIDSHDVR